MENSNFTFTITLTFMSPSIPHNQSIEVYNETKHNFNLQENNKSCDLFQVCVETKYPQGQGNNSCFEGRLPYMPQESKIQYKLSKMDEFFTLRVNVNVSHKVKKGLNILIMIYYYSMLDTRNLFGK